MKLISEFLTMQVTIDNEAVAVTLAECNNFSELLKEQLARASNKMKMDANKKRNPRQFQIGEQVLLKL
jgi:hypothetical protein